MSKTFWLGTVLSVWPVDAEVPAPENRMPILCFPKPQGAYGGFWSCGLMHCDRATQPRILRPYVLKVS